jgi:hypothetical protein
LKTILLAGGVVDKTAPLAFLGRDAFSIIHRPNSANPLAQLQLRIHTDGRFNRAAGPGTLI